MVKCPGCGIEYSLGTRIYHSCEKNTITHGVIFKDKRIERPWNGFSINKKRKFTPEPKNNLEINSEVKVIH